MFRETQKTFLLQNMLEKYAREKTKYSKIFSNGLAIGGLGEIYSNCLGYNQSCYIFDIIREKSKLNDDYYRIYQELTRNYTKIIGIDSINLQTLLKLDDFNYKDKLAGCFTCSATSLFGGFAYSNCTENIWILGLAGGVINSLIKRSYIGQSNDTDFIFGAIASIVGAYIISESQEIMAEDDILHPEIL